MNPAEIVNIDCEGTTYVHTSSGFSGNIITLTVAMWRPAYGKPPIVFERWSPRLRSTNHSRCNLTLAEIYRRRSVTCQITRISHHLIRWWWLGTLSSKPAWEQVSDSTCPNYHRFFLWKVTRRSLVLNILIMVYIPLRWTLVIPSAQTILASSRRERKVKVVCAEGITRVQGRDVVLAT